MKTAFLLLLLLSFAVAVFGVAYFQYCSFSIRWLTVADGFMQILRVCCCSRRRLLAIFTMYTIASTGAATVSDLLFFAFHCVSISLHSFLVDIPLTYSERKI